MRQFTTLVITSVLMMTACKERTQAPGKDAHKATVAYSEPVKRAHKKTKSQLRRSGAIEEIAALVNETNVKVLASER